ncbi:MAG: hypothetical protein KDB31_05490 [Microthrixaceae bacterium]|nr:hypothetical protein [Microthrixaceae bacterium]
MRPQERPAVRRSIRLLSLRGRSSDSEAVELSAGLNVVTGASPVELDLLRSSFAALTARGEPGMDALVEVDGTPTVLDRGFAERFGLHGLPAPIVEVPSTRDTATVGQPGGVGVGADRLAMRGHLAEVAAREHALAGELELTSRELERERDLLEGSPEEGGSSAAPGEYGAAPPDKALHPADVAVMCDRLGELLSLEGAATGRELLERVEAFVHGEVYTLYRVEALDQLIEECRAAVRSAREYLGRIPSRGPGTAGAEAVPDGARPLEDQVSLDMEARTIARLHLLEELSVFWAERRSEVERTAAEGAGLLSEANEALTRAGGRPCDDLHQAMLELRELSAGQEPDRDALGELVDGLRAGLGPTAPEGSAREVLALAEQRLAGGAQDRGAWRQAHTDRVRELEKARGRLDSALEAVRSELAALRRGIAAMEPEPDPRSEPNPFEGRFPASPGVGDHSPGAPGAAGWSLATELMQHRGRGASASLPVLVVEPGREGHQLVGVDPLSVAALALGGQVLWVTDRAEVISSLEALGDEVVVVRA